MKVKLPTGILRPLPNAEAANKVPSCNTCHFDDLAFLQCSTQILKQVFLPPEALDWLSNQTKSAKASASAVERPKPVRKSGEKRKKNGGRTNGYTKYIFYESFFFLCQSLRTPGDPEAVAVIGVRGTAAMSLMSASTLTAKQILMITSMTPLTCS